MEGSIAEAYSFDEISMFISDYFPDEVLTKVNRVLRHDDGGDVELNGRLSVFGLPGRSYGKGKCIYLSEELRHAAHTYIPLNFTEIDVFVRYLGYPIPLHVFSHIYMVMSYVIMCRL